MEESGEPMPVLFSDTEGIDEDTVEGVELTIESDTAIVVDNCPTWNKKLNYKNFSVDGLKGIEVTAEGCGTEHINLNKPAKLVFEGEGQIFMGQTMDSLEPIAMVASKNICALNIAAGVMNECAYVQNKDKTVVLTNHFTIFVHYDGNTDTYSNTDLLSALAFAAASRPLPVDIHLSGAITLPSGTTTITVPSNVHLYLDMGSSLSINGGSIQVMNYGAIFLNGTINHSSNVTNM